MTTSYTAPTTPALLVEELAERLAGPGPAPEGDRWWGQSLAHGAAGTALVHIERAHTGHGTWSVARRWITHAASGEISAADTVGLLMGAPALAFVLTAVAQGDDSRYAEARQLMDHHVTELAHRRVDRAMARIRSGELPVFGEYDLFHGLTGIGAYLLHRDPGGAALERVLDYLVALSRPLRVDGETRPGWWVTHDPHKQVPSDAYGGHSNHGAAHGITGPLMLLAQAGRRGRWVDRHREALAAITGWLDAWRQEGPTGPWWPEHVTTAELRTGHPLQPGPARPSWCYGTPGIARAGQLAAIATGDTHRQRAFEDALDRCLADPVQTARLIDAGLCHGWAGVYQTVWRAARDASTPTLAAHLLDLGHALVQQVHLKGASENPGFLEGAAGTALALMTLTTDTAPISGWDACLLID
ncbi:lanthionine synthetase C family protein [Nocardiopsis sp. EMB25]|uniref:lanthionine synthetase C family protein n=1 Tax=Nocardiopsis sp. EMB25 TaxID=2835867 RepID=UPI0022845B64|nr:lanthionine synthetase C family protein [Nocardiopsis sp. EMB25]MCY9784957.1 lanthionine synthetase C family protein [Nocardiopsis sp. EMB25]